MIGVAGSVAVGKSTTARLLRELLAAWPEHPRVELVTTDGFLFPNAELERRGLMHRKGFPESYDRRALLRFVMDVKSGAEEVSAPVYSHLVYDIVPDERVQVQRPDILIVEGLNVLQPARVRADGTTGLAVSDFFDFSVYVDADPSDVRRWYVSRFLSLRETAFRDPRSYFSRFAELSPQEAVARAESSVGHHQRTEPGHQHPAHPRPGHHDPAQGPRPPGRVGPHPQGLSQPTATRGASADRRCRAIRETRSATYQDPGSWLLSIESVHPGSARCCAADRAMRDGLAQRQIHARSGAVHRWGLGRTPPAEAVADRFERAPHRTERVGPVGPRDGTGRAPARHSDLLSRP